jgi:hypothetical protein
VNTVPAEPRESMHGFLRVLELEAAQVASHPDAFDRIRAGALQAVLVRDVYSPAELVPVIECLERGGLPFLQTWFPEKFRSWFLGVNLNLAHPDLAGYFEAAGPFQGHLRQLFDGNGPAERVADVLAALDHGRPFIAPPGPRAGQHYMFTTLRAHMERGYIPPHFDNEQALRPSYAHLRGLVEKHMTSYVLTLSMAEDGGALEVFDLHCEPEDARMISIDGAQRPSLEGLQRVAFRVPAGNMIILDSGRYLHQLLPVRGTKKRWTACSFIARARDGRANYCWG